MFCGYVMRTSKSHDRHYLKCETKHVSKEACIGAFIPVKELEWAVIEELRKLTAKYLDMDDLERQVKLQVKLQSDLDGRREQIAAEIGDYEKKVAEYVKGIKDLYLDKVKGIISGSDFLQFSKDFYAEKDRMEMLISDAN